MLASDPPRMKLGMSDAPLYLSFIGDKMEVKIKTLILFERSHHPTDNCPISETCQKKKHERHQAYQQKDLEVSLT